MVVQGRPTPTRPRRGSGTAIVRSGSRRGSPSDLARFSRDLNVVLSRGVWRVFEIALPSTAARSTRTRSSTSPTRCGARSACSAEMDEFAQSRYRLESRYHHVLVDEFQDTSRAQWELVWRCSSRPGARASGWRRMGRCRRPSSSSATASSRSTASATPMSRVLGASRREHRRACGRTAACAARSRKSFRAVPALLAFVNDLFDAVREGTDRPDAFAYGESTIAFRSDAAAPAGEPRARARGWRRTPRVCAERVASEIARCSPRAQRPRQGERAAPGPFGPATSPSCSGRARATRRSRRRSRRAASARTSTRGSGSSTPTRSRTSSRCCGTWRTRVRTCARRPSCARGSCGSRTTRSQLLAPELADALVDATRRRTRRSTSRTRPCWRARASACAAWLPLVDRLPPAELLDRILAESAYVFETARAGAPRRRART